MRTSQIRTVEDDDRGGTMLNRKTHGLDAVYSL